VDEKDLSPDGGLERGLLSAFRFRAFRLLWAGAFLSSVGTWTQDVALAWLIHTEFKNPVYLGLQNFVANTPLLAFMLLGGAVADRVDRRRILLTSQIFQMSFAASLGVLFFTGRLGLGGILLFAFLTGLAQSQSAPTYQAVLTSLVPPTHIPNAVALNSLQFNLSRAIGPVIAGILLVRAGIGACFVVNALSFVGVIAALWTIEIPSPLSRIGSLGESLKEGLRYVQGDPLLAVFTGLGAIGSFLAFPLLTYLPVIAGDVLRTGAAGYSKLLTSFGAGAILGALMTAQRGDVPRRGQRLLVCFMAYGAFALGAAFSPREYLSMAFLMAAGWSVVSAFSILNSLVQENAPESLRGRIVSIYGLAFRGGMPLGSLTAGFLVRLLGAPLVVGTFSLLLLLVALGLYSWNERLRTL
jgi:MFS family permease